VTATLKRKLARDVGSFRFAPKPDIAVLPRECPGH
jgi:hypothetical protein